MKSVIIYGNCHTTAIKQVLKCIPEFNEKYVILNTKPIQDIKTVEELYSLPFEKCDVFIHQSIWSKNRYGPEYASENLIKRLSPNCKVIAIPNLYHMPLCFFPQYSSERELNYRGNTIFFRDKILDDAFLNHQSLKQTVAQYTNQDLFDSVTIRAGFNAFIEKVKIRECDWDIKISSFLVNNYKGKRLFFDPNHPTGAVIFYIVEELLQILLPEIIVSNEWKNNTYYTMDTFEMPVTESVIYALNLNGGGYTSVLRKSPNGIKLINTDMNLLQYIKQYWIMEWSNKEVPFLRRAGCFIIWFIYKVAGKLKESCKS